MKKPMRLLVCASVAALIFGAAPIGVFILPAQAQVEASVTAGIAPPLLPVYAQPPIPGPGYLWIPGYWAWSGYEYYWVPGYWALPPAADLYWTPPYWAWNDGQYVFYAGYWGPTVGFYGGVDYGFGYTGVGYQGGYWRNNAFVYNSAVNNFGGTNIANAYSRPVASLASRIAFSGGHGGTMAKPTSAQIAAREHATPPTAVQARHQEMASRDPALRFNANHGQPHIAAMQRANEFHGPHAVAATNAPAERRQAATRTPPARPKVAQHAARPQIAQHAPAAAPRVAAHATAARPQIAQHAPPARSAGRRARYCRAPAFRLSRAGEACVCRAAAFCLSRAGDARAGRAATFRLSCASDARAGAPALCLSRAGHAHGRAALAACASSPHLGGMRMGGAPHMGGMRVGGPALRRRPTRRWSAWWRRRSTHPVIVNRRAGKIGARMNDSALLHHPREVGAQSGAVLNAVSRDAAIRPRDIGRRRHRSGFRAAFRLCRRAARRRGFRRRSRGRRA